MNYQRAMLIRAGREALAERIEQVSVDVKDLFDIYRAVIPAAYRHS